MQVDVGGHHLHCTLTHGLGDSSSTWVTQTDQLSQHYQVLPWDLRAHGKSDSPAGEWTTNDLSGDLHRPLTVLEIPSTRLLGHSAGGAISTHFALQYPQQGKSLTLVGSASEANKKASRNDERLGQKAQQEGGPAILKAVGLKDKPGVIAPHGPGFAKAARCMRGLPKPVYATTPRNCVSGLRHCRRKRLYGPRRLTHFPPQYPGLTP